MRMPKQKLSIRRGATLRDIVIAPAVISLVAIAGEEIVCPDCGHLCGIFLANAFGSNNGIWPIAWNGSTPQVSLCPICDGNWLPVLCYGDPDRPRLMSEGLTDLQIHIRSGDWMGWRMLGAG